MQRAAALRLYNKFVAVGGVNQVNLQSSTREAVEAHVSKDLFPVDLFQEARDEVLRLMDTDVFERFKKDAAFKSLISTVGGYEGTHQHEVDQFHEKMETDSQRISKSRLTETDGSAFLELSEIYSPQEQLGKREEAQKFQTKRGSSKHGGRPSVLSRMPVPSLFRQQKQR